MRSSALLVFVLLASQVSLLYSQDPETILSAARVQIERLMRRSGDGASGEIHGVLESLATLTDAPPGTRERACRSAWSLLGGFSAPRGPGALAALHALEVVGRLGQDAAWVTKSLRVAARADGPFVGNGFLAERALAHLDRPAQLEAFVAALIDPHSDEVTRDLALGALAFSAVKEPNRRLEPAEAVLVASAVDPDPRRRERAVRVLARVPSMRAQSTLLRSAADPKVSVRVAVAAALGERGAEPGSDVVLVRLLEDPEVPVREAAAWALRAVPAEVTPLLLERLAVEPLRVRAALADALSARTRLDLGTELAPWSGWWAARSVAKADAYARAPTPELSTYHGVPVRSDRVLFVVDVSGSMGFNVGPSSQAPDRMQAAKEALDGLIERLDERTRFSLVVFGNGYVPWSKGLSAATPDRKERARRFVAGLEARGGTDTHAALRSIFVDFPDADTVHVLSDGVPSQGVTSDPLEILRSVEEWNRERRVTIHTVALLTGELLDPFRRRREDKVGASRFLSALAATQGGRFVERR